MFDRKESLGRLIEENEEDNKMEEFPIETIRKPMTQQLLLEPKPSDKLDEIDKLKKSGLFQGLDQSILNLIQGELVKTQKIPNMSLYQKLKLKQTAKAIKGASRKATSSIGRSLLGVSTEKKSSNESVCYYLDHLNENLQTQLKKEGINRYLLEQILAEYGIKLQDPDKLLKDIEKESEDHSLDVRLDLSRKSTWKKVTISWLTIKEEEE